MSILFQFSKSRSVELNKELNQGCPLNGKNLSLITETDHMTGKCLCFKCECKKHTCPRFYYQQPYPTSAYRSQYATNFSQKVIRPVKMFKYQSNFLPLQVVDSETTNQHFYDRSSSISMTSPVSTQSLRPSSAAPKINLARTSTYASSFQQWSVNPFPIMKQMHINHAKNNCRLENKTIYRDSFLVKNSKFKKQASPYKNPNIKLSTSSQCGFSYPIQSTHRKEFQDYTKIIKRSIKKSLH